jgi:hypothetical protein
MSRKYDTILEEEAGRQTGKDLGRRVWNLTDTLTRTAHLPLTLRCRLPLISLDVDKIT